jgi:protein TonB
LHYPPKARDNNIQGWVYLSFMVEKDGTLSNIKVLKGAEEDLDREALSVLNLSPKWNPGTQRVKPVEVSYAIPILFKL